MKLKKKIIGGALAVAIIILGACSKPQLKEADSLSKTDLEDLYVEMADTVFEPLTQYFEDGDDETLGLAVLKWEGTLDDIQDQLEDSKPTSEEKKDLEKDLDDLAEKGKKIMDIALEDDSSEMDTGLAFMTFASQVEDIADEYFDGEAPDSLNEFMEATQGTGTDEEDSGDFTDLFPDDAADDTDDYDDYIDQDYSAEDIQVDGQTLTTPDYSVTFQNAEVVNNIDEEKAVLIRFTITNTSEIDLDYPDLFTDISYYYQTVNDEKVELRLDEISDDYLSEHQDVNDLIDASYEIVAAGDTMDSAIVLKIRDEKAPISMEINLQYDDIPAAAIEIPITAQ